MLSLLSKVINNGGKLALWRMGDEKWSTVDDILEVYVYDRVPYSDGIFFAIVVNGLTISTDPAKASFEIMEVAPAKPRSGFGHDEYDEECDWVEMDGLKGVVY
ncbi:hypothetical protein SADUNF_Sadunf12G0014500 [Salix dunnii]|uniref:Uncharacterized protein n=1 Tax=Salix dunnii TaxID=1413687 RepID=A0A835MMJ6_9ROSI|nr:hypothetical protein SADUNF_Sadunf12G0014500 [Salix dunnii]